MLPVYYAEIRRPYSKEDALVPAQVTANAVGVVQTRAFTIRNDVHSFVNFELPTGPAYRIIGGIGFLCEEILERGILPTVVRRSWPGVWVLTPGGLVLTEKNALKA
jgi:hypothetical protein